MKNLFLFACLSISAQLAFAQVDFKGITLASISDGAADKRVSEDCAGLIVQAFSYNADLPLKAVEIRIVGEDKKYPYKTNKDGETFILTDKEQITIDIVGSGTYIGGSCSDIKLVKGKSRTLQIFLSQKHEIPIDDNPPVVKKPVIYLYPEKELDLDINLKVAGEITFSYPAYKDGWKAKVQPNGDIKIGDKTYPYLFWEGKLAENKAVSDFKSGFVIQKAQVVPFLEEKLAFMRLNEREMTDFITFWAPQLEQNEFNFIHFVCGEDYATQIAELELSVKPDSEIRVNMFFAPVGADFKCPTQSLSSFPRKGFTVVEWGGAAIKNLP